MSTLVIIKPAGVRHENIGVLLFALLVLGLAAGYIDYSAAPRAAQHSTMTDQIDSRHDLNPIEQGLHADLKAAAEDILWRLAEQEPVTLKDLNDDLIPPFANDVVSQERGGHLWRLISTPDQDYWLYIGSSAKPSIAGSFALLVNTNLTHNTPPTSKESADAIKASLWFIAKPAPNLPTTDNLLPNHSTIENALKTVGWKQVVSHFDASATRPGT